jgi:hypothetical protein
MLQLSKLMLADWLKGLFSWHASGVQNPQPEGLEGD